MKPEVAIPGVTGVNVRVGRYGPYVEEVVPSLGEDRVVLIFEANHPDLRPEERAAIEYAIGIRERWIRERRVPS